MHKPAMKAERMINQKSVNFILEKLLLLASVNIIMSNRLQKYENLSGRQKKESCIWRNPPTM
jgi:hypothetical protein